MAGPHPEGNWEHLWKLLDDILDRLKPAGAFHYSIIGPAPKEIHMPLSIASTTEENFRIKVSPTTSTGKPSAIEPGSLTVVTTSGGGSFTVEDDAHILFLSEDGSGASTYQISADADLGGGVETITDVVDYAYQSPKAVNLGLSAEGAVPK